jgi:hypothetical protein
MGYNPHTIPAKRVGVAVTLLTRTWEVLGSHLPWDAGYPD